ncbi:site-specific integrase [Vibrio parahaemolyticus]|uniref:site-specific integrase n=1 Tax=Vibrio harveyi group TaxID=717610 RepID=UPI000A37D4E6|nr:MULTISPECIES: site-specific integrase [Vibrio harveyi group]EJG0322779.1 site-specific integrase [Vibrio parahaemolyticus]MBS9856883.1 site-specific integrase [Vibrio alginolyticus]MCS0082614.1 site-specific integrase [Vibrio alginolyticus]OUJ63506.1 hypothetical protein BTO03_00085 [Vibrio parahaemolyticus]TOA42469.1 hypothetical protein CGK28_00085 [Vibrio parahaemolyticus]
MQRINDNLHNGHWIYLYNDNLPILIPCIYSRYTRSNGSTVAYTEKLDKVTGYTKAYFQETHISDSSQYDRGHQLGLFLEWVDEHEHPYITLDRHTAFPADIINEYINDYLIAEMEKSLDSVTKAVTALTSYYNWLTFFLGTKQKKVCIYSDNRALARANGKTNMVVKYLLPATRHLLYRESSCLLEKIVLMNGGEQGCRSSENRGFYLDDFKADGEMRRGLKSLFQQLRKEPEKEDFEYHLPSFNTKTGRSRKLYLSRHHLQLMERYYETERPLTKVNQLLVSNARNHTKGRVIGSKFASQIFYKISEQLRGKMSDYPAAYSGHQTIQKENVYHHLRHSFGTDIFYNLCLSNRKRFETITTESAVYLETARRMGHSITGPYGAQTTKTYIHACGELEALRKEAIHA